MTQNNIEIMNKIVDLLNNGMKFSKALKCVYEKRNVCFKFNDETLDIKVVELGMSTRTTNALMRSNLFTLKDVVNYCENNRITDIKNLGLGSGIELFETILDCCWDDMDKDEKTNFLIDTIEHNKEFVRI